MHDLTIIFALSYTFLAIAGSLCLILFFHFRTTPILLRLEYPDTSKTKMTCFGTLMFTAVSTVRPKKFPWIDMHANYIVICIDIR